MTERPETRFTWNGDVSLGYQVLGDGVPVLLYRQGWVSNIELNWDHPVMARFLRGLARKRRLVMHDVRGMGVSERASPSQVWPLETVMEDLVVLLDELGIERTSILATNANGPRLRSRRIFHSKIIVRVATRCSRPCSITNRDRQ